MSLSPVGQTWANLKSIVSQFTSRGAIGTNSLLAFTSLAAQFFSNAVVVMILARLTDVSTLGEILYAIVFANIIVVLASYGFDNLVVREVSQETYRLDEIITSLLVAKAMLVCVLVAFVRVFLELIPIPVKSSGDLWFYVGAALTNSFINSLNAIRKGKNDFVTEMVVSLVRSSLFFVGVLVSAAIWGATTALVGQVRLVSRLLALVFAASVFLGKLRRESRGPLLHRPSLAPVRVLFAAGLPFALQAILGTAYYQVDSLVLGALATSTEVGYYQTAMQLVSGVMLVPIAVIQAHYPRLAKELVVPGPEGFSLVRRMLKVLGFLGLCLATVFGLGAPVLITVLYGAQMEPSIAVLRILSLVFLIRSLAGGLGIGLMSIGAQNALVWGGLVALLGSVGLNLVLIPRGGYIAVAWVSLTTNLVILCIYAVWWAGTTAKPRGGVEIGSRR